ncbi:MAG: 2-oxoacid:acceptor oxidoreductase family protein [Defluviitaleaceae bacterium]|nr:2-oxoacid:acceptor oxidoreductase family protein [Defluviitaleaceae bacterium]MCL2239334.1 2-oxoacid:acceptor oxidoreductase family protein [Defluviitaleaceae bacterium]
MATKKMVFSGFGGQGILVLAEVVATIAMKKGDHVTWMPSYGAEMRGGTANCAVITSHRVIGSPIVQSDIDILCAMNKPSVDKFLPRVKSGGLVLVNSSIVTECVKAMRDDVDVLEIDATNIAVDIGNQRVANMVMLAGFLKKTGLFTIEDITEVLHERFGGARSKDLIPLNLKAIERGLA